MTSDSLVFNTRNFNNRSVNDWYVCIEDKFKLREKEILICICHRIGKCKYTHDSTLRRDYFIIIIFYTDTDTEIIMKYTDFQSPDKSDLLIESIIQLLFPEYYIPGILITIIFFFKLMPDPFFFLIHFSCPTYSRSDEIIILIMLSITCIDNH